MIVSNNVSIIISEAFKLGLNTQDLKTAEELLKHHEFFLSLDTVIVQMYEYDIAITVDFYNLVENALNSMNLPPNKYYFMKDLILKQ